MMLSFTPSRSLAHTTAAVVFAIGALIGSGSMAVADDRLRVAAARRGTFDGAMAEIGQRLGIMGRQGIELDINYVWASRDTITAVASKAADIGLAADLIDVLAAYQNGAAVRIIANQSAGAHDLYWYVRAVSPIKSWADTGRRTLAYSTDCCTRAIVDAFVLEKRLKVRPVATGWPSPTLTQVLSGQIDIGWAMPPFGLEHLDKGEIRILGFGSETRFGDRTMRVAFTTPLMLATRSDAITRFMRAMRQTVAAMYSDPKALKAYADWRNIPIDRARRLRDTFFPRAMLEPDRISGIEATMNEAVARGELRAAIPGKRMSELVQRLPR